MYLLQTSAWVGTTLMTPELPNPSVQHEASRDQMPRLASVMFSNKYCICICMSEAKKIGQGMKSFSMSLKFLSLKTPLIRI